MENKEILETIQKIAEEIGFDLVGIVEIASPLAMTKENDKLDRWVGGGYHADMKWFAETVEKRKDILKVMPDAKSVICVALNYYADKRGLEADLRRENIEKQEQMIGRVAGYARGRDYHKIFDNKLKLFLKKIKEIFPNGEFKCYCDTGPVLDRAWAVKAGLGFIGKNTNLITRHGSWVLLGEIITNIEIPTFNFKLLTLNSSCGSCRRCLDVCPTGALCAPYAVDARKCISYLTIEHKGEIPIELLEKMGNRIFGCDACQEVCPFNIGRQKEGQNFQKAQDNAPPYHFSRYSVKSDRGVHLMRGLVENGEIKLQEILSIKTDEEFLKKFAGTPLMRAKRRGLVRNACIAAGNSRDGSLLPYLEECLNDNETIIAGAARLAIAKLKA